MATITPGGHGLGWTPSLPDFRDHEFKFSVSNQPANCDLSPQMPPIFDQGALGSCTANAIALDVRFKRKQAGLFDFAPSRLAIYWGERYLEGSTSIDAGAYIRDGFKVINTMGVASEDAPAQRGRWLYDISKFMVQPPPDVVFAEAHHKIISYAAVPQTAHAVQAAIYMNKPVVIGFTVYESFESAEVERTGVVPMPQPTEQVLGGHAVLIVGYDMVAQRFKCANSWGPNWGKEGYFTVPYAYFLNPQLAGDLWTTELVKT